jgi:GNAT superfamily N-acetyltransferase
VKTRVVTHAERPDLGKAAGAVVGPAWSEFMHHDAVANEHLGRLTRDFSAFQLYVLDDEGLVAAVGNSVPFVWDGTVAALPNGIDGVLPLAMRAGDEGAGATALSAVQIVVRPDLRARGLSSVALEAMAQLARAHGLTAFVAPVRPTLKAAYPLTPIEWYAAWTQADGLLFDPWLRTHERLGAEIVAMAPASMTVAGTVADWEEWTGMAFPESGAYVVPEALVPVDIDRERDEGLYVEPNVWMRHPL